MFTVSYGGGHVLVDDTFDEPRRRLERKLHPFFLVRDELPAPGALVLGQVQLHQEVDPPKDAPWRPALLHSGSHDYDLRRARVTIASGKRWIDSYDSGSMIVSDPGNRIVHVHNTDLNKGGSRRPKSRSRRYLPAVARVPRRRHCALCRCSKRPRRRYPRGGRPRCRQDNLIHGKSGSRRHGAVVRAIGYPAFPQRSYGSCLPRKRQHL